MSKDSDTRIITRSDGRSYTVRNDRNRIFTPDEWKRFLTFLRPRHALEFKLLMNTGARINEALHIKKSDINFKDKVITLRVTKRRGPFSDGNPRRIRVSSDFMEELESHCEKMGDEETVLQSRSAQSYSQILKRRLKEAGIKDWYMFSLHNIRKTMECWLCFLGVNYLLVLKHMGHDTSTAVKHYLQTDTYSNKYKFEARKILGDVYI